MHSGLLHPSSDASSQSDSFAAQSLLVLLLLMEDEDPTVRLASAQSAGRALALNGQQDCLSAAVPYVQQQTFAFIGHHHGDERRVVEQMLAWIYRWIPSSDHQSCI